MRTLVDGDDEQRADELELQVSCEACVWIVKTTLRPWRDGLHKTVIEIIYTGKSNLRSPV